MDELIMPIAKELNISSKQVENTLKLLEDGNTVPFIARYRKEATNGLDEEQILYIQKQYAYQLNLKQRKEDVIRENMILSVPAKRSMCCIAHL